MKKNILFTSIDFSLTSDEVSTVSHDEGWSKLNKKSNLVKIKSQDGSLFFSVINDPSSHEFIQLLESIILKNNYSITSHNKFK